MNSPGTTRIRYTAWAETLQNQNPPLQTYPPARTPTTLPSPSPTRFVKVRSLLRKDTKRPREFQFSYNKSSHIFLRALIVFLILARKHSEENIETVALVVFERCSLEESQARNILYYQLHRSGPTIDHRTVLPRT